jgi:hypothetical protein
VAGAAAPASPGEVVLEDGERVAELELPLLPRPRPLEPEVVDGLLDGLEDLVEGIAGAAERHRERAVAVLARPRVLREEVEVRGRGQLEEHARRVPTRADVHFRGGVVSRQRRPRRGQGEDAAGGFRGEEPRVGGVQVRRLIPVEPELPPPQPPAPQPELLVLLTPFCAAELGGILLVGREDPELEVPQHGAFGEVPVLLPLRPPALLGLVGQESPAGTHVALDVPPAQGKLGRRWTCDG